LFQPQSGRQTRESRTDHAIINVCHDGLLSCGLRPAANYTDRDTSNSGFTRISWTIQIACSADE
jgi:hypothetical protein